MFRDLLSARKIQVGLIFFVVVVTGSLLYNWHVQRTTTAEFARTDPVLQPVKNKSEMPSTEHIVGTSIVDFEQVETPLGVSDDAQVSEDTDMSPIDEGSEAADMADAFLPDGVVSKEALTGEVPVSPYGFGPYPEVPADFPETIQAPWNWPEDLRHKLQDHLRNFELMTRVLIKLWNEGDHAFTGGEIYNDTVYPKYPNTVYVRYTGDLEEVADGFIEGESTDISAGPGVSDQDIKMIRDGETPPGIRILDMDTDGINAYSFLNLK